jgi:hypothetical protein
MTESAGDPGDERVRAELARAFRELRPQMYENAARDADLDPESRFGDFSEEDVEQFLNAFEALMHEAFEGEGRARRDLILDTALPPVMELGQTPLSFVRSNVISAVMLSHRLLPLVAPELRDDAARWLARFWSQYTLEIVERAMALQSGER